MSYDYVHVSGSITHSFENWGRSLVKRIGRGSCGKKGIVMTHNVMEAASILFRKKKLDEYDAQYLRLAQKLNGNLVSFDRKLLKIADLVSAPPV